MKTTISFDNGKSIDFDNEREAYSWFRDYVKSLLRQGVCPVCLGLRDGCASCKKGDEK